jgi:HPt (histidine-containing phosphotransfer) domain-containing protein
MGISGVGNRAKKQSLPAVDVSPLLPTFDSEQFEAATLNDAALQVEILGLFDDQLNAMLGRLAAGALSSADAKFLGHTLRGSAAAIGAQEIEALAAGCEKSIGDQDKLQEALKSAATRFNSATAHYRAPPVL